MEYNYSTFIAIFSIIIDIYSIHKIIMENKNSSINRKTKINLFYKIIKIIKNSDFIFHNSRFVNKLSIL